MPERGRSSTVSSPQDLGYVDLDHHYQHSFTFIPLILDVRSTRDVSRMTSTRSDHTTRSEAPNHRLPTPEFPSEPAKIDQLGLFLTRGVRFNSFKGASLFSASRPHTQPPFTVREHESRPMSVRSVSSGSEGRSADGQSVRSRPSARSAPQSIAGQSVVSFASTLSVDSGHASLITSIGTTEKFTHKWLRPRAGTVGGSFPVLEDGRGLGMDKIERWTSHKWCLLLSVCSVFAYGAAALVCALLTWFRAWEHADVMYVAENDILILITLAGSILLFTALTGMTGALLNSRPILAVYTLLLWPAFMSIIAIGYASYKRSTFSLDHKLNLAWSQYYTQLGRLYIQDSLRFCGYYNALHDSTSSKHCYPRTTLPGCKGKLYRFEKANLELIWSSAFGIVPLHIVNMAVALVCANHVTTWFGKGITPKGYRLTGTDVKKDAEKLIKGLTMPQISKASSTGVFREDRKGRGERSVTDCYAL